MSHQSERDIAEDLFAAWERWDLDTIGAMLAEDAVDERPQSGERFVGRANILGMYREVPGPPQITWRSVRGGPLLWVGEGIVEYGEGPVHLVGIVELAEARVITARYYFADPFNPPAGRSHWRAQEPQTAE